MAKKRKHQDLKIAATLVVCGCALLVIAGALITPVAGVVVAGVLLVAIGIAVGW